MKWNVTCAQTVIGTFAVEADTVAEAEEIGAKKFKDGVIELPPDFDWETDGFWADAAPADLE